MGRGQQVPNLLYGTPQRKTANLDARIERRFGELTSLVGAFDPRKDGGPDMEIVGDFERLITDCDVPASGAAPGLITYSSWVRQSLETGTPFKPGAEGEDHEDQIEALRHSSLLLARASHRMTDPMLEQLVSAHVAADLSAGEGWKSLQRPLGSLMQGTPLKHRLIPVVYRRLTEPWGKNGIRRAPEGKYLVHYSAGAGKVLGQGKALCGASLTRAGHGGDWNSSSSGKLKVTCERCRRAVNTRPSEMEMAIEDETGQLIRLHQAICSRTKQRVRRELDSPKAPLDVGGFDAMLRGHAWDALLTELQVVCERFDYPLSNRTMQVLRRVPSEPERLDSLREEAIPAITF